MKRGENERKKERKKKLFRVKLVDFILFHFAYTKRRKRTEAEQKRASESEEEEGFALCRCSVSVSLSLSLSLSLVFCCCCCFSFLNLSLFFSFFSKLFCLLFASLRLPNSSSPYFLSLSLPACVVALAKLTALRPKIER